MKLKERVKNLSKKQQVTIATVAVLTVFGSTLGYKAYAEGQVRKNTEQAQSTIDEHSQAIKALDIEIKALFHPENPDFLNEDVTEETLAPINDKLTTIEEEYSTLSLSNLDVQTTQYNNYLQSRKDSLARASAMLTTQEHVNDLFEKTVITGDTTTKDTAIADDLKKEAIQSVKESSTDISHETSWQKAIDGLVQEAENQMKQIEKAQEAVRKVYLDNKVISTEQAEYDEAKTEVDKIKNAKAKNNLDDQLDKVKHDIDEKAKQEAEKQAQAINNQEATVERQTTNTDQTAQQNGTAEAQGSGVAGGQTASGSTQGGNTGSAVGGGSTGGNTGGSVATPPSGGGSTGGSGGGSTPAPNPTPTPTPPPAQQRWVGWWNDGVQLHYAGTFNTEAEALAAGRALYMANGRVGSWGASET